MFDIIKDLKENIQKSNMKILVLSAALGMFCYCTNNAMKKQIKVDDVLIGMLRYQVEINNTREEIKDYGKRIYVEISEEGVVAKKKLLDFITNQYLGKWENKEECKDDINKIEQYFHLDKIENDDVCMEKNLTEIFWTVPEPKEEIVEKITEEERPKIKRYFAAIIQAENAISEAFKKYYYAKKQENTTAEKGDILGIIIKECCGKEKNGTLHNDVLENLRKLYEKEQLLKDQKDAILAAIQRRITLENTITIENLKAFIIQKIGEEKKIVEDTTKDLNIKKTTKCPCCDCWEKKKQLVDLNEKLIK